MRLYISASFLKETVDNELLSYTVVTYNSKKSLHKIMLQTTSQSNVKSWFQVTDCDVYVDIKSIHMIILIKRGRDGITGRSLRMRKEISANQFVSIVCTELWTDLTGQLPVTLETTIWLWRMRGREKCDFDILLSVFAVGTRKFEQDGRMGILGA